MGYWSEVFEHISDCKTTCAMENCGINHHCPLSKSHGLHLSERGRSSYTIIEIIQVGLWISVNIYDHWIFQMYILL